MAYPEDIRDLTVSLCINGEWVDVTSYVLHSAGIGVNRGAGSEDNSMPPTTLPLTFYNGDQRFNSDNPMSPYYPYLQQNTPLTMTLAEGGTTFTRFYGEVPDWPMQVDSVATDSRVAITAAGIFRRWERGQQIMSPLRRSITAATNCVAYWPMEDESENAQSLASGIPGKPGMLVVSAVDIAAYSGFAGSKPVPDIDTGHVSGPVSPYAASGNQNLIWITRGPVANVDTTIMTGQLIGGTIARVAVLATTTGDLRIRFYDRDGAILSTSAYAGTHNINDLNCLVRVIIANDGADVDWRIGVINEASLGAETVTTGTVAAEQIGRVSRMVFGYFNNLGIPAGHGAVFNGDPTTLDEISFEAFPAFLTETAGARYIRLCREHGIAARMIGDPALTPKMGAQPTGTLRAVLQECAEVDHGIIFESRDEFGVTFLTRVAMENQSTTPAPVGRAMPVVAPSVYLYIIRVDPSEASYLWEGVTFKLHYDADDTEVESTLFTVTRVYFTSATEIGIRFDPPAAALPTMDMYARVHRVGRLDLDYGAHEISRPFVPVKDDRLTANRVVLTRRGGSEYTAEQTSGPRSIYEPPAGIGLYETPETLNLYSDGQLAEHATWMLHQGVLYRPRFPNLTVGLHRPQLASRQADVLNADIGHTIVISDAGRAGYYEPLYQIARGYQENYDGNRVHHVTFNTTPGDLFNVLVYDETGHRYSAAGSTLAEALDSTSTGSVDVAAGDARWTTDPGDFPLDVLAGGERITVSAVSGTGGNPAFVSSGLAFSANGASVSPGMPAGIVSGNVVLIAAAVRSFTATVDTPTGWTDLTGEATNVKVFARTYDGVWTMPAVTFTGALAGDTTHGVSAAFSGIQLVDAASNTALVDLSGEQDLYVLTQNMARFAGQKALRLAVGHKWDDWSSVTVGDLSDFITITATSSGLGDDGGLIWGYAIDKTSGDYPERTMVWDVSGGAVAVYTTRVYLLPATPQVFTISARSVNGVVKAHAAGTPVDIADPRYYGL